MRSIRGRFVCRAWKCLPLPGCYLGWYLYRFWTSSTNMSLRRPEMALNAKIRKGVAPIVGVDCGRAVRPNEVLCECWTENLDVVLAPARTTKTEWLQSSFRLPCPPNSNDVLLTFVGVKREKCLEKNFFEKLAIACRLTNFCICMICHLVVVVLVQLLVGILLEMVSSTKFCYVKCY